MKSLASRFLAAFLCWAWGLPLNLLLGNDVEPGQALARVANESLRMPAEPPSFGYQIRPAFGSLTFPQPVAIVTPPGETNRLFICEKEGRISLIEDLSRPARKVFLDLSSRTQPSGEGGLLGLAFHPRYAENRFFYVFYTLNTTTEAGTGRHQRVARFETAKDDPARALVGSELPLITQYDEASNHNGGDLHFGPDGYLYISVGDEGGANDNWNNSQRINKDFFAGILRIDVDHREGSLAPNPHPAATSNYSIPPDNPFVGISVFNGARISPRSVRTEFWAVGLRNAWRMAFDPPTGRLITGDVGQGSREEINLIVKGGNYGWSFLEGTRPGPDRAPTGFEGVAPVLEYGRTGGSGDARFQGNSVTGGVVYRGDRLSQLTGAYVFSDYVSGNVWGLWLDDDGAMTRWERLTFDNSIAAFGVDPRNGDVLLADLQSNQIKRLGYSTRFTGAPIPSLLSNTGAFVDLETLTPNPGIVPYDLNVPFWSDNAIKRRWFSVPRMEDRFGFERDGAWIYPTGSIWIKHFDLEMTVGDPESARRIETRFLVRNSDGVYGVTYRWNDSQTNAQLVDEEGDSDVFMIQDGETIREQVWLYPSRNDCLRCHTPQEGLVLGFHTAQLNREFQYPESGRFENQIAALGSAGYFAEAIPRPTALPALAAAADPAHSLEYRVRSYLQVNCAPCHQPGGTGRGEFDARHIVPTRLANLVEGVLHDDLGLRLPRKIKRDILCPLL